MPYAIVDGLLATALELLFLLMEEGIFGEEQYHEDITKEQMYEFFGNTEIGVAVVCVYIRYSETL